MKKLFCVLICLLLTLSALVSCGDVDRSDWLGTGKDGDGRIVGGNYDGYNTVVAVPEVKLNLYIIVEDETWEGKELADNQGKLGVVTQAINTVNNAVKDYTLTNYQTALNIVYVKASEYDSVVLDAVEAKNTDAKAANIVLVNSYSLMQQLYATGKLCSLDAYLETNKYGQLNTNIPTSLLEASKIEGTVNGVAGEYLYTIPNNHVIGSYEYLLVNKELVKSIGISATKVSEFKSYEEAVTVVSEKIPANNNVNVSVDEVVSLVSGSYEDRFLYDAQGYYYNIVKNPLADKNEAFMSAFAIVNRNEAGAKVDVNDRAMQIIYDLNMNYKLRNILQYGVAGTNYKLDQEDDTVVSELEGGLNLYRMNLIYTGNILNAFVCQEIGWTEEAKANTYSQNQDSVSVKGLQSENNESSE